MSRPFRERLLATPIVLEVVPPSRRAGTRSVDALATRVVQAVGSLPDLDALNLPEVLDENHIGAPFKRNMEPREFAARFHDRLPVDLIVNKVVVHMPSPAAFRTWAQESVKTGAFRNFVLAGGLSSRIQYPGPTVIEANRVLRSEARGRADLAVGNITIPERAGEVDRLVEKTRAGGDFFTTQVLFEVEPMASVLRAYGPRCREEGLSPATVLLSFAPVSDYQDIEFLAWLGATVTPKTEEALLSPKGRTAGTASLEVARALWSQLRAVADESRPPIPLGVNIEEVSLHNFDLAVQMAREFPAWRDEDRPPGHV